MIYNDHSNLSGKHALLSPSGCSWLNYDPDSDSLIKKYKSAYATVLGTALHEYADKRIKFRLKMTKHQKNDVLFYLLASGIPETVIDMDHIFENLMMYVNDAIGFKMDTEQILYYSDNCYGTADAISFRNNTLRIHDLKTGTTRVHIEQLMIYTALFCLEYNFKPSDMEIELRIYQNGEILYHKPSVDEILPIMDQIISLDSKLQRLQA